MRSILRSGLVPLLFLAIAVPATATEYVLSGGIALPQGDRAEVVSTAGVRHVLAAGFFGEAAVTRMPSDEGGLVYSTLAYAKPWRSVRTGAGVLALRAPDRVSPGHRDALASHGFQLAAGLQLPVSRGMGVDLDARYVFFDRPEASAAPSRFATRYWTLTLGLAILGEESQGR